MNRPAEYEVAWQMPADYDAHPARPTGAGNGARGRKEGATPAPPVGWDINYLGSLARVAGFLAEADAFAVVRPESEGTRVELGGDEPPLLPKGSLIRRETCGAAGWERAIEQLLHQQARWHQCDPPDGYDYAYLLAGPALVQRRNLLLLTRRHEPFSGTALMLASTYLSLTSRAPAGVLDLRRT